MSEGDASDLLRLDVQQPWYDFVDQIGSAVRVSTVDNYQGEEADLIVASLVRSNQKGSLGFLGKADAEQRLNVLCTRARLGLILIGNVQCLERSPLWQKLFAFLREQHAIFDGLPIRCGKHHAIPTEEMDSAALLKQCINRGAGCGRDCDAVLKCGHCCPLKCHPFGHDEVRCERAVRIDCPARLHRIERACSSVALPFCQHQVVERCPEGHPLVRLCGRAAGAAHCGVCQVIRSAEKAHDSDAVERARREADVIQHYAQLAVECSGDAPLHAEARADLEALSAAYNQKQREVAAQLTRQLDAAEHHAQEAVGGAMAQLERNTKEDEMRLQARRQAMQLDLRRVEQRQQAQSAAATDAAKEDVRVLDVQLHKLHVALANDLRLTEEALHEERASRPSREAGRTLPQL